MLAIHSTLHPQHYPLGTVAIGRIRMCEENDVTPRGSYAQKGLQRSMAFLGIYSLTDSCSISATPVVMWRSRYQSNFDYIDTSVQKVGLGAVFPLFDNSFIYFRNVKYNYDSIRRTFPVVIQRELVQYLVLLTAPFIEPPANQSSYRNFIRRK
jgi:hypothetical protein